MDNLFCTMKYERKNEGADMKSIWKQVLEIIEKDVTPVSYSTWFENTKLYSLDKNLKIAYL